MCKESERKKKERERVKERKRRKKRESGKILIGALKRVKSEKKIFEERPHP